MLGAPQECAVAAEDTARVNELTAAINAKFGTNHQAFTVVKCSHQVVAGTNHFYHLTADGHSYTITVFEPLPHTGQPAHVSEGTAGHVALAIGHGQ